MVKKGRGDVTLAEHARRIAPLGGKASMENRTEAERQEFARSGGLAGGAARAEKLSPARRKAIAKKAAAARWGKKKEGK